jgi:hypothetical protein
MFSLENGELVRRRKTETFRFVSSSDALRVFALSLIEIANDADKKESG